MNRSKSLLCDIMNFPDQEAIVHRRNHSTTDIPFTRQTFKVHQMWATITDLLLKYAWLTSIIMRLWYPKCRTAMFMEWHKRCISNNPMVFGVGADDVAGDGYYGFRDKSNLAVRIVRTIWQCFKFQQRSWRDSQNTQSCAHNETRTNAIVPELWRRVYIFMMNTQTTTIEFRMKRAEKIPFPTSHWKIIYSV